LLGKVCLHADAEKILTHIPHPARVCMHAFAEASLRVLTHSSKSSRFVCTTTRRRLSTLLAQSAHRWTSNSGVVGMAPVWSGWHTGAKCDFARRKQIGFQADFEFVILRPENPFAHLHPSSTTSRRLAERVSPFAHVDDGWHGGQGGGGVCQSVDGTRGTANRDSGVVGRKLSM
jgi:hypothetical protein